MDKTTRGETVRESLSRQERLDENGGKQSDNNDEVYLAYELKEEYWQQGG